jgi:hypothetical protein
MMQPKMNNDADVSHIWQKPCGQTDYTLLNSALWWADKSSLILYSGQFGLEKIFILNLA